MTVSFQLAGQEFIALNGGPEFKFTEAISFSVSRQTQEEETSYGIALRRRRKRTVRLAQGQVQLVMADQSHCVGWVAADPDPEKSNRVMQAMLQMGKIDIAGLKRAYEGQ
jgi:predicted 3-demethylubiquinone-9 3-methyltransferase (glyoxalase superfamily)